MNYVELARQKALKYGIDPDLFVRQIQAESSFNPKAVSSAGAIGLGQIMPATAKELGINPEDPDQNLEGAARYMRQQLDTFGEYPLALAAYNAGAGNVRKAGGIPNFTETQNYVSKIMGTGGSAMNANPMSTGDLLAASEAADKRYKEEQAAKPLFQKDSFKDMAADLALAMNDMSLRPSEGFANAINSIKTQRTEGQARNKTVELMRKAGRDDLAAAADAGVLTAKEAYVTMLNDAAKVRERQASMTDAMTLAKYKAGLTAPKVSAGEQKISRLMETGLPRETAIAIADGRIISSRDPQTGRVVLLDKGTGQVIGQAPAGSENVVVQETQATDMFEGLDIRKGTGARGWANKYINLVSDAVFGGQYASEAGEVREAMNVLGLETLALADTSFAGKPTNFLRERVQEAIVINPAEISTGPDRAQKKAAAAIGLLERSLAGAQRAMESSTSTLEERKSAAAAIPQIESLLLNYRSLENALSSKLNPPSSPAVDPANIDLMKRLLQAE
jgi:hypothetical protein